MGAIIVIVNSFFGARCRKQEYKESKKAATAGAIITI
jgi:hypothetical protein